MSAQGDQRASESDRAEAATSRNGVNSTRRVGPAGEQEPIILVDASNVAHGKTSTATTPKIENLRHMLNRLKSCPVRIIALADASLRHKIDQKDELEAMFRSGELEQVPAGTGADDFLWQLWKSFVAQGTRAYIVTNDQFPLTRAKDESREERPRIAFLFLGAELMFQPPLETLLSLPPTPPSVNKPEESSISRSGPGVDVSSGEQTGPDAMAEAQSPEARIQSTSRTQSHDELIDSALEVIAGLTQPPGGPFRRVNFATVSHNLHQRFGGDFVSKFGLVRPKALAEELVKRDLVTISYTNTTMYVEPTIAFEGRIIGRGFSRRELEPSGEATPTTRRDSPLLTGAAKTDEKADLGIPQVIEVSSRDLGPTVEIPGPELFLKLVRDSHPKHVFHWWSQRKTGSRWQLEGEFFFVLEGTTYRLSGHGYRTLGDFVDGRARGMKDALDPRAIGGPELGQYYEDRPSPQIWRAILRTRNLDEYEYRPAEGDVYYCVQERGFADFTAFLAAERAKPEPPVYV